jgi:hypothetical protein
MKTTNLKGQIGEALVVAELGKQGYLATSFVGNAPHFDIVAFKPYKQARIIQVKSITNGTWQGDLPDIFFEITLLRNGAQKCEKKKKLWPNLIWVFVETKKKEPEFYICTSTVVRNIVKKDYFTQRNHTIRPKRPEKPKSHHQKIKNMSEKLKKYKDAWKLICQKIKV